MSGGATVSDAVLMTLAGIAYGEPGAIAGYVAQAPLTAGEWSVAWLAAPPDPPVNFAFLAKSARTGAYVLAIRGTYPNPFSPAYWADGDQDSPFGAMVVWPGAPGRPHLRGHRDGRCKCMGADGCGGSGAPRRHSCRGERDRDRP